MRLAGGVSSLGFLTPARLRDENGRDSRVAWRLLAQRPVSVVLCKALALLVLFFFTKYFFGNVFLIGLLYRNRH